MANSGACEVKEGMAKFSSDSTVEKPTENSEKSALLDIAIEPHPITGVYVARDGDNVIKLVTRCISTADDGYGDSDGDGFAAKFRGKRCNFRIWSPYQSKLAAALLKGAVHIHIFKGTKLIYLADTCRCSLNHLANIVGHSGCVYAVGTNMWARRELLALAKKRSNIVVIAGDSLMPYTYRQIVVDRVDFILCDVLHKEQLRILILHSRHFLKAGGHFAIILSVDQQEEHCSDAINQLLAEKLVTLEQISLQPYVHGQFMVLGVYNPTET